MAGTTFSLTAPDAQTVSFASDCFGWDTPREMQKTGDQWTFSANLPADVRMEYQFVVDGKHTLDPGAPSIDNGLGGRNSVFQGPEYTVDVLDHTPAKPMRRLVIRVSGHAAERDVVIYAPRGPYENLPLVVYGDGHDYETRVRPQNILQNLFEAGRVPPCILVLVPPVQRMGEYWKRIQAYEQFLAEDVLPEVRVWTKATEDPERVFVGGASLGGHIALRLVQNRPDVFAGGVHSQSGAFWASPGAIARSALKRIPESTRLFFDWGSYEGVLTDANTRLVETLERLERPVPTLVTNEGHTWSAWRRRFTPGIEHLLADLR